MFEKLKQTEISAILGVDRRHVNRLVKAGMPKSGKFYNAVDCVRWFIEHREGLAFERGKASAAESEESRKQLARYRKHRADLAEIEVGQAREQLCPWGDIEAMWRDRVVAVTSGLENMGDRLAGLLAMKSRGEVYSIIKTEIRDLRLAYARQGKYCPEPFNVDEFAAAIREVVARFSNRREGGGDGTPGSVH